MSVSAPLRSVLFVPAANEKAMAKAASLVCDAIIFDLEDSAGVDEKGAALDRLMVTLDAGGFAAPVILVRIDTAATAAALVPYLGTVVHGLVVPKVSSSADVRGLPDVPLWAMIETARGVVNLKAICETPGVAGLIVGPNDLRADLRVTATTGRSEIVTALSLVVLHARAYGLSVIDGVYNNFRDDEGLRAECDHGKALGFDGKTLIHPAQIAVAEAAFAPSAAQLGWARAVVAAFAAPENAGKSLVAVDGEMVELMHLATAQRWLGL
ncbi:CoA ester lyase [Asticcacaulis sp. BYS171W]|uniref:CoA ester lyase n=1 Tax=Asticcacaulis aquaticus TaxID=2984212 RepID=A0ABT5HZ71_9CAUL|nr:CoA ester lyase [Asticcacaulis aquaticus]MDC7685238.1 CoA ester lyase [Asticcacaulis aquaticus]